MYVCMHVHMYLDTTYNEFLIIPKALCTEFQRYEILLQVYLRVPTVSALKCRSKFAEDTNGSEIPESVYTLEKIITSAL